MVLESIRSGVVSLGLKPSGRTGPRSNADLRRAERLARSVVERTQGWAAIHANAQMVIQHIEEQQRIAADLAEVI